jgi:hypothetical protein
MTIGPKNDPRPLILHVDSETGIPYRLAESDSLTVPNLTVTNINGESYTPGVGPGGIDPTAINVTSLQGTGAFFLTALTGTFVLTATTGVFATTSYVNDELANYCGPLTTPAQGDIAYYDGTWQRLSRGSADQVLTLDGSPLLPSWKTSTGSVSIPVAISEGGSNYTGPYENNGLLYFNGTRYTSNTQLTFDGTTLATNTLTLTTPLSVANGGTGNTAVPTANQVIYSDGTKLVSEAGFEYNPTTNKFSVCEVGLTVALSVANGGTGGTTQETARTGLGLGTIATENSPLPANKGGTGTTTVPASGRVLISDGTAFTSDSTLTFDTGTDTLSTNTLNLTNALATAYGGTGRTSFVTGALYANSTTSIERHEGLTDLAGFADNNPYNPEYPGSPPGPYYYYPNYAALPFVGFTGRYVRLQTGITAFTPPYPYGKVLTLYDPAPDLGFGPVSNFIAEPRWEFLDASDVGAQPANAQLDLLAAYADAAATGTLVYSYDGNWTPLYANQADAGKVLKLVAGEGFVSPTWGVDTFTDKANINSSSVTPSAVSATYQYGSPFVWQYGFDAGLDAQVTATNGWWGGLQLSSWIGDALLPELDNFYITNKTGYYPSANLSVVSLSATTVSATNYLNLTGTWDLSTLNSYYINVSGDSANAGFHFSSVSANGMVLSAAATASIPLQVRFASGSTASHAVFASADGTEIARLNLRGTNNLFLGKNSGNSWSTGSNNVAIGHQASQFLSTGSDTVAIGSNANYNSTTSQRNTSIGSNAGSYPGTSTDNVNIGYYAGYTQKGSFNVSIGPNVNYSNFGSGNVGLGYQALTRNTSGTGNIGVGYRAGYGFSSTASNNIAIGQDINITEPTTFSNTIVIGSGTNSTASNQTIIGHPQTSSTIIRGAVSAASYVNAPTTSGAFTSGDILYYNGSFWISLPKPTNQAVLIFQSGASYPSWIEADPGLGTYSLQSIDGTIQWAG